MIHHVTTRGDQIVFRDDRDREALLSRVSARVRSGDVAIYAWALMPNHLHLLVGTTETSLAHSMASLFDAPYKSLACETGRHFVELVRYIHLNPLRGGIVRDVDELEDYPYTGHSALLSTVPREWQSTAEVLARFGRHPGWARAAYRKFVCDGALIEP